MAPLKEIVSSIFTNPVVMSAIPATVDTLPLDPGGPIAHPSTVELDADMTPGTELREETSSSRGSTLGSSSIGEERAASGGSVDASRTSTEETTDHIHGGSGFEKTVPLDSGGETESSLASTVKSESASSASPSPEYVRDSIPGFTILKRLGKGGMGVVYKAEQHPLKKMVALKRIRDDHYDKPSNLSRFITEAQALARLDHPNIVKIFHYGDAEGRPYLVFELLEGGTLEERLKGDPTAVRYAAEMTATLARAVHEAHKAGIMHRDLKPSNVLFNSVNIPKIADFGLAKRLEIADGETRDGQVLGTPTYMSPEQARGWDRDIGPSSDIYSLGVILYEMLTGKPPHKGMNSDETIRLVREKEPVPPSKLRPNIPYDLETVCLKCLDKEPSKRYASSLELAEDLERFLAGRPVLARRTPFWEQWFKLARRHPVATTSSLIALIAAVGIGWGIREAREAARVRIEQRRAEELENRRLEGERIREVERKGDAILARALEDLGAGRWSEVKGNLLPLRASLDGESALSDLKARTATLLNRADAGEKSRQAAEKAQADFRRFVASHDDALFLDLDGPRDQKWDGEAVERAAIRALAIFGLEPPHPGRAKSPPPIPRSLSSEQSRQVSVGSHELLLVLAEAVSRRPDREAARRADDALAILEWATVLHPEATKVGHLHRAAYLDMMGRREEAAGERERADAIKDYGEFDLFLIGREFVRANNWQRATQYLKEATHQRPYHFWARCLLAICHLQANEPAMARELLDACVATKPDSVQVHLWSGIASAALAMKAREAARENPVLVGGDRKFFQAAEDEYRQSFDLLDQAPRADDTRLRYALFHNRGVIRLERGDYDSAVADFREAIQLDGRRFDAYSSLAEADWRRGNIDEAYANLTRAIELRPGFAPLYRARAGLFLDAKDLPPTRLESVLRDLADSVRHEEPGSRMIAFDRTNQASLLLNAKHFEEALAACDEALQIQDKYARAHLIRIRLLLELRRHDEILEACAAALRVIGGDAGELSQVYELRGMANDARGRFNDAVEDYTLALARRGENAGLHVRRGWSNLLNEAYRAAADDFDKAIRINPEHADAYAGRGFSEARLGKYADAAKDAEKAVVMDKAGWRIPYKAARVYVQAAVGLKREPRKLKDGELLSVTRYPNRAMELLAVAMERVPADERATTLADFMKDPALKPLGQRLEALKKRVR